jgi:16S rRNA (guanine(966)-N(2))-methyltransferase RsmD
MRIIAGTHRGRPIVGPEHDRTTRPITDRVKKSLFDRLASAGRLEDAIVLDLFSGTGSMGLECLSRGATHVTFVERDRSALARLKQNLEHFGFMKQSTIVTFDALGQSIIDLGRRKPFTLMFCDPPYRMTETEADRQKVEQQILRLSTVSVEDAVLVLRTSKKVDAAAIEGWAEYRSYGYGSMSLHFYFKRIEEEAEREMLREIDEETDNETED